MQVTRTGGGGWRLGGVRQKRLCMCICVVCIREAPRREFQFAPTTYLLY